MGYNEFIAELVRNGGVQAEFEQENDKTAYLNRYHVRELDNEADILGCTNASVIRHYLKVKKISITKIQEEILRENTNNLDPYKETILRLSGAGSGEAYDLKAYQEEIKNGVKDEVITYDDSTEFSTHLIINNDFDSLEEGWVRPTDYLAYIKKIDFSNMFIYLTNYSLYYALVTTIPNTPEMLFNFALAIPIGSLLCLISNKIYEADIFETNLIIIRELIDKMVHAVRVVMIDGIPQNKKYFTEFNHFDVKKFMYNEQIETEIRSREQMGLVLTESLMNYVDNKKNCAKIPIYFKEKKELENYWLDHPDDKIIFDRCVTNILTFKPRFTRDKSYELVRANWAPKLKWFIIFTYIIYGEIPVRNTHRKIPLGLLKLLPEKISNSIKTYGGLLNYYTLLDLHSSSHKKYLEVKFDYVPTSLWQNGLGLLSSNRNNQYLVFAIVVSNNFPWDMFGINTRALIKWFIKLFEKNITVTLIQLHKDWPGEKKYITNFSQLFNIILRIVISGNNPQQLRANHERISKLYNSAKFTNNNNFSKFVLDHENDREFTLPDGSKFIYGNEVITNPRTVSSIVKYTLYNSVNFEKLLHYKEKNDFPNNEEKVIICDGTGLNIRGYTDNRTFLSNPDLTQHELDDINRAHHETSTLEGVAEDKVLTLIRMLDNYQFNMDELLNSFNNKFANRNANPIVRNNYINFINNRQPNAQQANPRQNQPPHNNVPPVNPPNNVPPPFAQPQVNPQQAHQQPGNRMPGMGQGRRFAAF